MNFRIDNVIRTLILMSSAFLIIRIGIIKPHTLQFYELFIIFAFILFLISSFLINKKEECMQALNKQKILFILINIFLLFGMVNSYLTYGINKEQIIPIIKSFFWFYTVFFGFILNAHFGKDEKFRKLSLALMSIPIIFSTLLFILPSANTLHLLGDGYMLQGLHANISDFAIFLLISLALFTNSTLYEKKVKRRILFWIGSILTFSLILWTGSRGAWLASTVLFISLTIVYSNNIILIYPRFRKIVMISAFIFLSVIVSFLLLPHQIKVMSLDRIFPKITNYSPKPEIFDYTQISFKKIFKSATNNGNNQSSDTYSLPYQNRQDIWPQAINSLIHHPFGLGPNYSSVLHTPLSHNTFLQAGLSGGFPLLILILFAVWYIFKKLYLMKPSEERTLFFSLWISFLISVMFNDNLFSLPWIWITAGLILGKSEDAKII